MNPTVLVSGAIANKPGQGGAAWTRLSWLLGLRQLGFDVYFVEQIAASACVDENGGVTAFERSGNVKYFRSVVDQLKLGTMATLVHSDGEQTEGLSYRDLIDVAESCEFLINISGHLTLEPLKRGPRCRVYVDLDPGFTQFWQAAGTDWARLADHDLYFTVGENVGTPHCSIPTGGFEWRPIRQPVVLEEWPIVRTADRRRFTTVATWRGPYGPVEYGGRRFGVKAHEFRSFIAIPERVDGTFEIALNIHSAEARDQQSLVNHGWQLVDPARVVADPVAFRRYVQESGSEFSVAQGIYVDTNSGWFSDRSVRYLASGKPVLVQDTGFSRNYPVGEGLLAFRTPDEAVAGAKRILEDYQRHCQAARALAEQYFASTKVLSEVVDHVAARIENGVRSGR